MYQLNRPQTKIHILENVQGIFEQGLGGQTENFKLNLFGETLVHKTISSV